MSSHRTAAMAAGAGLFLGLGVALGRWSVDDTPRASKPASPQATARAPAAPDGLPPAVETPLEPRTAAHSPHPDPAQAEPAEPLEAKPLDLGPALAAARTADSLPDDEEARAVADDAARDLHLALGADPQALNLALQRFEGLSDPSEVRFLSAVFGQLADPAVEAFAIDLVTRDPVALKREAGLEILAMIESPRARDVALGVLETEADTALRRAALHAIPAPTGVSETSAAAVTQALAQVLARDTDPESRRRAALVAGRYGADEALLNALANDPHAAVRAGSAFALEASGQRSPQVVAALVRTLQTPDEDPLVQENAWRALGAMAPLPESAHQVYREHAEHREALGEADE